MVLVNDGKGTFTSGPRLADKGVAPCLGDIDNDGDLDLWLGSAGGDLLLLGDGKGKFTKAPTQPESEGGYLTTCAAGRPGQRWRPRPDRDADQGRLSPARRAQEAPSKVFNNNLDGTFTEVASAQGLALGDLPISAIVLDDFDKRLRTVRVGRLLIPDGPFHSWL